MPGKRVQFDDYTLAAIEAVARASGKSFQELADEAFADLLKKRRQPVGLKLPLRKALEHGARHVKPMCARYDLFIAEEIYERASRLSGYPSGISRLAIKLHRPIKFPSCGSTRATARATRHGEVGSLQEDHD